MLFLLGRIKLRLSECFRVFRISNADLHFRRVLSCKLKHETPSPSSDRGCKFARMAGKVMKDRLCTIFLALKKHRRTRTEQPECRHSSIARRARKEPKAL